MKSGTDYEAIVAIVIVLTALFVALVAYQTLDASPAYTSRTDTLECPLPEMCEKGMCDKNYIAVFTADWCRACKHMYPVIQELRDNGYLVVLVNVDKHPEAAKRFNIKLLPTSVVVDKGKEVTRYVGVHPAETLSRSVRRGMKYRL